MRRAAVFFALLAAGCGRTDQPTSSPYLPIFSVITTRLPDGHVGEDYDARVVALAEPPAVSTTWSVSGALPPGLAILPEGATSARVVGTPTTPGTSTFRLQLVDVDGRTATGDFSVSILGETLRILTSGLPMARAGELYEGLVEADGGVTPYTWRVLGALPEGLSARGSGLDLAITGSPQELGVFDLEVEVTDAVGAVATRALRLEVDGYVPLRIVTANLPQASLRSEYRAEISATGGEGAYTWILAQGRLPAGLTLGGAGTPAVELAGLPTEAGRFSFLVRVSDGRGTSAERRLVLEVGSTVEPLRILTSTFPEARADRAYEAPVVAEGGLPPYQWRLESGQLPPGLSLDAEGTPSSRLVGTPQVPTTATFTLAVMDQAGQVTGRPFSLTVLPAIATLRIVTASLPDAVQGRVYQASVLAEGGLAPYQWSISQGRLPPGVTLAAGGGASVELSGVPTVQGIFSFEVAIEDAEGTVVRQVLRINVGPPPTPPVIVTPTLPDAVLCTAWEQAIDATGGYGTAFTWQVVSGALPPGSSLVAAGTPGTRIVGAPTAEGTFTFEVQATDGLGQTVRRAYSITVTRVGWPARWAALVGPLSGGSRDLYLSDVCGPQPTAAVRVTSGAGSVVPDAVAFSSDNRKLAYIGDYLTPGVNELYMIDLSAGTPGPQVRLHTPIGPGRAVQRFAFSPDGTKIAFVAAFSIPGVNEVYVVDVSNPAAPSAPVRVSAPPTINSSQVLELLWSPTSDRLAYRGSFDDVFRTDLYVSTLVGPHVRLTTAGGSNTTVYEAAWTATGTGLVYRLNDRVLSEADLYWHPIGGSPQRLSALRPGGSVFAFDLAPDGLSVTFEATQRTTSKELFWRALTGISPAVLVNPPFSVGRDIVGTEWSPVGSRFVYVADQDFPNLDEPYLVEVTSAGPGAPRRLLSSPATSQDVVVGSRSLAWSPDGRWLGFLRTDLALPNQILVIDASSPALPVASLALDQNNPALDAVSLLFAPDGGRVAVLGALMTAGVTELFVSDLRGAVPGPTLRVNPALVTGGDVTASVLGVFRADGQGLYYVADQVTDDVPEAWSVPLSPTPGAARRMHAVLSPGRSVERIYVQR